MSKNKQSEKPSDYNCCCGRRAVQFFPKFAVDTSTEQTICKPYCYQCLARMKWEVTEDLMKNGRIN
jgi:hypothetical protein